MTTRLFGSGIRRREDPRLITGAATYTDDIKLQGLVHAAILRSTPTRSPAPASGSFPRDHPAPGSRGWRTQIHGVPGSRSPASGCSDVPRRQPEMAPVSGAAVPRSRGSNDPPPGRDVPQKRDVRVLRGVCGAGRGSGASLGV